VLAPEVVYAVERKFEGLTDHDRPPDVIRGGSPAQTLRLWSHEDAVHALKAEGQLSHHITGRVPERHLPMVMRGPVNWEGETHRRYRRALMDLIDNGMDAEGLQEDIEKHAEDLVAQAGPVISLSDLAERQVFHSICLLLDNKALQKDEYRNRFFGSLDTFGVNLLFAMRHNKWFERVIKENVAERLANPPDEPKAVDTMLGLPDEELSRSEKENAYATAFFATGATTAAAISLDIYAAYRHLSADDLAGLAEDSLTDACALVHGLYDEGGRMYTPAQVLPLKVISPYTDSQARHYVTRGFVEVGWGSASRNPILFPDPDKLILDRHPRRRHMGFSYGRHSCLGVRFSRMQAVPLLRAILRREAQQPMTITKAAVAGGKLALRVKEMQLEPLTRQLIVPGWAGRKA
jgi:cytochrome P450